MSSEVSSIDCDGFDQGFGEIFGPPIEASLVLHQVIFSQGNKNWYFVKDAVLQTTQSALVQKTQKVARDQRMQISPTKQGGSGEVGWTVTWGGKNGVEFSGYAKGEVYDDR